MENYPAIFTINLETSETEVHTEFDIEYDSTEPMYTCHIPAYGLCFSVKSNESPDFKAEVMIKAYFGIIKWGGWNMFMKDIYLKGFGYDGKKGTCYEADPFHVLLPYKRRMSYTFKLSEI